MIQVCKALGPELLRAGDCRRNTHEGQVFRHDDVRLPLLHRKLELFNARHHGHCVGVEVGSRWRSEEHNEQQQGAHPWRRSHASKWLDQCVGPGPLIVLLTSAAGWMTGVAALSVCPF